MHEYCDLASSCSLLLSGLSVIPPDMWRLQAVPKHGTKQHFPGKKVFTSKTSILVIKFMRKGAGEMA